MHISEVSNKYHLSLDTLRYYEKIGLIDSIKKEHQQRIYDETDLNRIEFILCLKNAGLSLADIKKFIGYYQYDDETFAKRIAILSKQKALLEAEIKTKNATLAFLNYKINYFQEKIKEKK